MKKFLALMLNLTLLFSVTLFGEIFEAEGFTKLNNTIIKISGDTTLQITAQQNYSMELPQGNYTLTAFYYDSNKLRYYAQERLTLNQEIMQFDLVLLPEELRNIIPVETDLKEDVTIPQEKQNDAAGGLELSQILLSLALGTILFLVGYTYLHKKQAIRQDSELSPNEVDDDCGKVLKILKENEGRMNQKEIRDILNFSETKMSLVVAELESMNKIKKIKKGRENILKLLA